MKSQPRTTSKSRSTTEAPAPDSSAVASSRAGREDDREFLAFAQKRGKALEGERLHALLNDVRNLIDVLREAARREWRLGDLLQRIKGEIDHGQFQHFLAQLKISKASASRWRQVRDAWESEAAVPPTLSGAALYAEASRIVSARKGVQANSRPSAKAKTPSEQAYEAWVRALNRLLTTRPVLPPAQRGILLGLIRKAEEWLQGLDAAHPGLPDAPGPAAGLIAISTIPATPVLTSPSKTRLA